MAGFYKYITNSAQTEVRAGAELGNFHSTYSLPPDHMHDLLEGAVAEDLLVIIKILIHKKYFSEDNYNRALKSLDLRKHDANDKPEEINVKSVKLKGKEGT